MSEIMQAAERMEHALKSVEALRAMHLKGDAWRIAAPILREAKAARVAFRVAAAQPELDAFPEEGTSAAKNFDAIVAHLRQRIEDGDLDAEDVPVRMVRYGLTDPRAFEAEMLERIDMSKADAEAGEPA